MSSRFHKVQALPNGLIGAGKRPVLLHSQTVLRAIGRCGSKWFNRHNAGRFNSGFVSGAGCTVLVVVILYPKEHHAIYVAGYVI